MILTIAAFAISLGLAATTVDPPQQSPCSAIDLDQGWSRSQSEAFWFTPQGSRMMPYSWFLALEVAEIPSQILFRDSTNMQRYGYISVPASARNPDGLPIGFANDVGKRDDGSPDEHVGLTCAACHTGSLTVAGKPVIVEGGPALADFWPFLTDVVRALATAANDPTKFDRFSKKVLNTNNPSQAELNGLRHEMNSKLADLQTRLEQNAPKNPYGNGRVDAFGHIFTRLLAQVLHIPENAKPPYGPEVSAPVSYPFLWDTPYLDVVQWNGSAPNSRFLSLGSLSRNLGEVIGVFGELEITSGRKIPFLSSPPKYTSSANLTNLIKLEEMVRTLWSPVWPKNCLPLADGATLAKGKKVYEANCLKCHSILGSEERKNTNRQITAVLKPVSQVMTDPAMATNFVARKAKTGPLKGTPNLVTLWKFGAEASARDLLLAAVNGVLLADGVPVDISGININYAEEPIRLRKALDATRNPRYKARPLNGIWATAPYLHNGSVPTLYDLLTLPDQRPAFFYVGSREFDPIKVGLVSSEVTGAFRFDTSIPGNLRIGHPFGTSLSDQEKKWLLEFLKTL